MGRGVTSSRVGFICRASSAPSAMFVVAFVFFGVAVDSVPMLRSFGQSDGCFFIFITCYYHASVFASAAAELMLWPTLPASAMLPLLL